MNCNCKVCLEWNKPIVPFEHYLHVKRWTTEEDERDFKGLTITDMYPFSNYLKGWVEQAVYDIKKYEKEHPEWKELGDKERQEYWEKK